MKNIFVFYRRQSRPSAKALHLALKEKTKGRDVVFIRGNHKSKFLQSRAFDYIVNVGNSEEFNFRGNPIIINPPEAVRVSANKRLARIRFKAKKLSAPTLWMDARDIPKREFPVVGRTSYHMKAKGFWYCRNLQEALAANRRGATHFMKFIRNTREFRAHVFAITPKPKTAGDYIIAKLSEKVPTEGTDTTIIKNHDNGYHFLAPTSRGSEILSPVRMLAKEVICKFGLHYGGVDIMYSMNVNKPLVLEINSTPCLTDDNSNTLDIYVDKFLHLTDTKKKNNGHL